MTSSDTFNFLMDRELPVAAQERLARQVAFAHRERVRFAQLTRREREVLTYVASGHDNKAIARVLFRSVGTVRTHRQNIRKKLGLRTVVEAVWWAQSFGLV